MIMMQKSNIYLETHLLIKDTYIHVQVVKMVIVLSFQTLYNTNEEKKTRHNNNTKT